MAQLSQVARDSLGMVPPTRSTIHFSYKGGRGSLFVFETMTRSTIFFLPSWCPRISSSSCPFWRSLSSLYRPLFPCWRPAPFCLPSSERLASDPGRLHSVESGRWLPAPAGRFSTRYGVWTFSSRAQPATDPALSSTWNLLFLDCEFRSDHLVGAQNVKTD